MIRAIAIDDELPSLQIIEAFCKALGEPALLATFQSTAKATLFLDENAVQLIFLDINMPSLLGTEFYKSLEPGRYMVVFTTAYSEYAVEGFDLDAVDYLLKPFTIERFEQAVNKVKQQFLLKRGQENEMEDLLVRLDYSLQKIPLKEIRFIESWDDYIKIYTAADKPIICRWTMKAVLEKLPPSKFCRVHRSYIVNLDKIDHVRNKTIFLPGKEVPLGGNYEGSFYQLFKN